jgi:hypothetical protein
MRTTWIACLLLFATTGTLAAQTTTTNPVVAYAYIGEAANRIGAFAVRKNGVATLVSGSPFAGPSRSVVVSSGFVFGTDGTNIATYKRLVGGGLHVSSVINGTAHNDTPVGSGVGTLTLDRSGSSLYASEINFQGTDNDAYAQFGVQSSGALVFRNNSAISVDYDSQLQFSQNNQFAYGEGCYFANWDITGLQRTANGSLIPFSTGNTFPPNPSGDFLCPSGEAASARGYLAIAYGIASAGSKQNVAIYRIASSGALELISNSITATNFAGIGGLRFDPTGNFLAVAGQKGIVAYRLNANGTLTRLGNVLASGTTFVDVKWDKAGHVLAISNGALYVFTLNSGGLSQTGAPHGLSRAAGSLAVLPVQ